MRLLHPKTLEIISRVATNENFSKATVSRKQVISHAWAEVLKYLATRQEHPKMFLNDTYLGYYVKLVKYYGDKIGCNLNEQLFIKYDDVWFGYVQYESIGTCEYALESSFKSEIEYDDTGISYLFSDAMSLYLKGINIFQYIYGSEWRKYVPIENLKEIQRIVTKTLAL